MGMLSLLETTGSRGRGLQTHGYRRKKPVSTTRKAKLRQNRRKCRQPPAKAKQPKAKTATLWNTLRPPYKPKCLQNTITIEVTLVPENQAHTGSREPTPIHPIASLWKNRWSKPNCTRYSGGSGKREKYITIAKRIRTNTELTWTQNFRLRGRMNVCRHLLQTHCPHRSTPMAIARQG